MPELPSSGIDFATVFDFNDDQFVPDEDIRQRVIRQDEVIGVNGIERDIAFSTDLRIGAANSFEVDRERSDHKENREMGCIFGGWGL
jgi:hypothetical protein